MFRVCIIVWVLLYTTEAEITAWTIPNFMGKDGSGTLSVPEDQATSDPIETYAATTDKTPITYTLVNAVAPFALSSGGELTITASLDFETASSYTLAIKAVDSDTPAADTGTATIAVTVTDVNEAPVFGQTSYTKSIANGSLAETSVITVSATDPDQGDTLTYSIESGNTNTDFKIETSSGEIKVNTGKTLNMAVTQTYTLIVIAADSAPLTGSTTVSIDVTADGNGSGGGGNGSGGDGNGSGGDGNGSGGDGNGSGGDGNGSGGDGNGSGTAAAVNIMTVVLTLFVYISKSLHMEY